MSPEGPVPASDKEKKFKPYVPEDMEMREFTWRAILLGLAMTIVLGAANAYLGLRAGITIAATYPAAVIAMAAMRAWKGSLLEENIARTAGSIGEGIAAGAIFTIPAFLIAKAWPSFQSGRRVLEIHRADHGGQHSRSAFHFAGAQGNGGRSGIALSGISGCVGNPQGRTTRRPSREISFLEHRRGRRWSTYSENSDCLPPIRIFPSPSAIWVTARFVSEPSGSTKVVRNRRDQRIRGPQRESRLSWRGIHHRSPPGFDSVRRERAGMGIAGPPDDLFPGPQLQQYIPAGTPKDWADTADAVWRYIVRPIAVGGMLVGAAYTLFKMRKSLTSGFSKLLSDMRQSADQRAKLGRTERYMSFKTVLGLIALMFVLMCALYVQISGLLWPAILAAVVMLVVGFFFATVSGNLVGFIGSSNNPVSGLTLSTLLIAALLMVSLGVSGGKGVAIVLGVAAVVCVSSSVAGELLQDFKVGYILGGTPQKHSDRGTDRRGRRQPGDVLAIDAAPPGQHQLRRRRVRRARTCRLRKRDSWPHWRRASWAEICRGRWWESASCSVSR